MNSIEKIARLTEKLAKSDIAPLFDLIYPDGTREGSIETNFVFDESGVVGIDLGFRTKVGGVLYFNEEDEEFYIRSRYGRNQLVDDVNDVLHEFIYGYRFRDFGHQSWLDICVDKGLATKQVETKTNYQF